MMKKDYRLIADAIVAAQKRITLDETQSQANRSQQLRGVRRTAAHLTDAFASRNPRFDSTRFLKTCGYGATKEGADR